MVSVWHQWSHVWHQSTARAIREQTDPMLSNSSRDTLISYTDHSAQRRLKSRSTRDLWHGKMQCQLYYLNNSALITTIINIKLCKCIENADSKTNDLYVPIAQTNASLGPTLTPSSLGANVSCYRCHCRNALPRSDIINLFHVNNRRPTIINTIFVGQVISRMMSAYIPAVWCLHTKMNHEWSAWTIISIFIQVVLSCFRLPKAGNVPASPSTAVINQCKLKKSWLNWSNT